MSESDDYDYEPNSDEDVTCKRCGKEGLTWYDIGTKRYPEWKLFDLVRGRIVLHTCSTKKMADNAFEDESNG